jgi:hypothetical protein
MNTSGVATTVNLNTELLERQTRPLPDGPWVCPKLLQVVPIHRVSDVHGQTPFEQLRTTAQFEMIRGEPASLPSVATGV